jgi:hypothetical protein
LQVLIPSLKRDCDFIKKSMMFQHLLRSSRKPGKSRHRSENAARAHVMFYRASGLLNCGHWRKLLAAEWEQTRGVIT